MAGDKPDPVDKVKAGINRIFSRRKKSRSDESSSATSAEPTTSPSSSSQAPSLPPISGIESLDASEGQAESSPSSPPPATIEPPLAEVLKPIPKYTPAEGMSATSGPLDDFETMQSRDREKPPKQLLTKDKLSTQTSQPDDETAAETAGQARAEQATNESKTPAASEVTDEAKTGAASKATEDQDTP